MPIDNHVAIEVQMGIKVPAQELSMSSSATTPPPERKRRQISILQLKNSVRNSKMPKTC